MVDLAASLSTCLDKPEQTRITILDAALSIMGAEVAVLNVVSKQGKLVRIGWAQVRACIRHPTPGANADA